MTTPGPVTVTIFTSAGSSAPSVGSTYTYNPDVPTVTSLSPTSGPAAGGTSVTVHGTNFTTATGVDIDGSSAATTYVSSTAVTISTPPHATGPVPVTVFTGSTSGSRPTPTPRPRTPPE
jgi:hypothetical protein